MLLIENAASLFVVCAVLAVSTAEGVGIQRVAIIADTSLAKVLAAERLGTQIGLGSLIGESQEAHKLLRDQQRVQTLQQVWCKVGFRVGFNA